MGSIARTIANSIKTDGTLDSDASNSVTFRNLIINGDLSVWQRGTSFTNVASGDFTADRWCMSYRAIGNADIAQVDNKTYKSLKVTNSNGSSQEISMRYRVEDVTQFNNDSFILSFYAKASTSVTLDTRVYENYGSGGSSTVTVVSAGSQNKTITTSRQRFTISFTTSDMSGKTIGSSNYLEFSFHPTLVSGANWEFDSVQLEKGTSVSDFEFVPYDVNIHRCERYFKIVTSAFGTVYASNAIRFSPSFEEMRSTPSVSGTANSLFTNNSADFGISSGASYSLFNSDKYGGRLQITGFSGLTAGNVAQLLPSGTNAGQVYFDAEL